MLATIPFLVVIAVDTLNRSISSQQIKTLVILLVLSLFFVQSIQSTISLLKSNARMGKRLAAVKEIIAGDIHPGAERDVIIMTRNPWQVYHSTRYKAIQIPNEELDVIYAVAQKYRATHLLLPAPRKALEPLYAGSLADNRFQFISDIPQSKLKLYRIRSAEISVRRQ